jgi:hypothetical protein
MDDESFLRDFEACNLRAEDWHHREHIKVAYLLLMRFPLEVAIGRMRTGLQALNAAQGVPDRPDRGYHETMTQAWMRLVDFTIRQCGPARDAEQFLEQHPELAHPSAMNLFYSQQRLRSPAAKLDYLPPDLHPLKPAWQIEPSQSEASVAGVRRPGAHWVIPGVLVGLLVARSFRRFGSLSFGGLLIFAICLTLIGLPIFIVASAIAGRRSVAFWTSSKARNIATGVYMFLCVVVGIASRLWRDSDAAGEFVPLGIAALVGMPVVVFTWLFTRQTRKPRERPMNSDSGQAIPHPLD